MLLCGILGVESSVVVLLVEVRLCKEERWGSLRKRHLLAELATSLLSVLV